MIRLRNNTNSTRPALAGSLGNEATYISSQQYRSAPTAQVVGRKCGFCAWGQCGLASDETSAAGEIACTQFARRRVEKHESLAREGEKLSFLYSLRFGQMKVIGAEHDLHHVTGFRMAGDLIGLESLATGRHRFRLFALEDSEVCEIPVATLKDAIAQHSGFAQIVLPALSGALDEAYNRASILSMRSLERRFAAFLLWISQKYARIGYSGSSFRLLMTRADIGSYLATSIESISRLVARFNVDGAARIRGRTVDILDRAYLEALACGDGKLGDGTPPGFGNAMISE